ncbi:3-phosphoglycerate kinase [Halopseudomonas nanhaiensis]|uniref:3-phosphoglycerate kinase n=1 Tax=Halopseudomonas nanhaiensis TaxID=2830842 RepID=UPI001CBE4DFE|nr:3-phosphoglycerate kinase [Halopseudomonas nanhaiensis]UAW99789.1 3-phosphoglycerate kinase [Halopseudomonas nanhaiensis]
MKRQICAIALAMVLPATTFAFTIDLNVENEGVDIEGTTGYIGNVATISLTNNGDQAARCEVYFENGPERPPRKRLTVNEGESTTVTQAFEREINRVRSRVACEPEEESN